MTRFVETSQKNLDTAEHAIRRLHPECADIADIMSLRDCCLSLIATQRTLLRILDKQLGEDIDG